MLKTRDDVQKIIVSYFKTKLKNKGVKIVSSGSEPHVRIDYDGDVEKLIKSLHNVQVKSSDKVISQKYPTQEIILKEKIGGAAVNDGCYLVVATSKGNAKGGVLGPKILTPDQLKLAGVHTKNMFKKSVIEKVKKNTEVPEHIKEFCIDLLDASERRDGQIKSKHIGAIDPKDINVIAKNFGELSGAWWYMNLYNTKATAVEYPNESNYPLVDYFILEGKNRIAVSAKANDGAPPSINAIADILRNKKYSDPKKEAARKGVIEISDRSVVDGVVGAAKALNLPSYSYVSKFFNKGQDWTAAMAETFLKPYKSPESLAAELDGYYKATGKSANLDTFKKIFSGGTERRGLIISPMGYGLVDALNSEPKYMEVLNEAAREIQLEQVYIVIKLNSKAVSYELKLFASSKFEFKYNSNARLPSLKKISFVLKK